MIKAGDRVAYRAGKHGINVWGHELGPTEPVFVQGVFEVWRTRAYYAWDKARGCRVVVPSMYRIVKRIGKGVYTVAGISIPCEYVFVMRCLAADGDWRGVLSELSEQVMLLANRERKHGD